jgi:signal peptidase II
MSLFAGRFRAFCLFIAIVVAGLAADLLTKHWVFHTLGLPTMYKRETEPELKAVYWIWQDVVGFQTALNPGALFGILAGQTTMLIILSAIFLTGITLYLLFYAWQSLLLTVILGMITAGICGNLYDRLAWHGLIFSNGEPVYAVRDWILCMIGTFAWPNFNIADSLLVCSFVLLLLHWIFWETAEDKTGRAVNHQ